MPEQLPLLDSTHWMSLITAAPTPELPERAVVEVLYGNGRPVALTFEPERPRLHGIAPLHTRRTYAALLGWARDEVAAGRATVARLESALGPQFTVEPPQPLFRELTDELIDLMSHASLRTPPAPRDDPRGTSQRHLREQVGRSRFQQSLVSYRKHPREMYESLRRVIPASTPKIEVVVRGTQQRDVLIDGISFEREFDPEAVWNHVARISVAFWELKVRVREMLTQRERREFRLVGIVQKPGPGATDDLHQVRGFALAEFDRWADVVVDGEREDPVVALNREVDWVQPAAS